MNRRRTTKGLDGQQVRDLWDAWHHARRIDHPLNSLISLRPLDVDDLTPPERCAIWAGFRKRLDIYARQHGFSFVAIWTRESNADGSGEHLHVLMHVPRRWRAHFEEIAIGWHPGPAEIDISLANYQVRHTPGGKRLSVAGYIMKQMTPQAWFKRGLIRKAGGPLLGKRGGCTRNIGWNARVAYWRDVERCSPVARESLEVPSRKEAA